MASSGSFNTTASYGRYLTFNWSIRSQDIATNKTVINWSLVGAGTSGWVTCGNFTVVINGTTVYSSATRINVYAGTTIASGTATIPHNTDGTKSFSASASAGIYAIAVNCSGSGTWALTSIPRYATVSQSLSAKTETTAMIKWTSDSTIDYIWYSTNNGSSWTGINVADGKSGTYTISGLSANTSYQIKTRVRRKDSQLTTDSSALSVTTYNWPYCTSGTNFMIGEKCTIKLYNPLGRSVTVVFICSDGSTISNTTTGTSYSGITATSSVNKMYASIPNATSASYSVRVVYGTHTSTKNNVGTYAIDRSVCKPSIGTVSYEDITASTIAITGNNKLVIQKQSSVQYTATGLEAKHSATIKSCKVAVNGKTYSLTLSGTSATGGNAKINSSSNVTATFTVTDSRGLTATKSTTIKMLAWALPYALITLEREDNFYSTTNITVDATYSSLNGGNTITITYKARKTGTSSYTINGSLQNNVAAQFTADNNYTWDVVVTLTDLFGTTTYKMTLARGTPIIYFDRLKSSVGINCFPQDDESLEVSGENIYDALFYKSGDTVSFSNVISGGFLTASGKSVFFNIPLPKSMKNVTPSITALTCTVRHSDGGYIWNAKDVVNDNTLTITIMTPFENLVRVKVESSATLNATNNTPIACECGGTIAFS